MSVSEVDQRPKPGTRLTREQFHALHLPEDSSLILLNGVVYDEDGSGEEMTKRNRRHARVEVRIGRFLDEWVDRTGFPATVLSGEVGCDLAHDGTFVGIDVAVFSNQVLSQQADDNPYVSGVPLLAVEILSPSDQINVIDSKMEFYLDLGVQQVWLINPRVRTIIVHSPNGSPRLYSDDMILDGGSVLPGFSVHVKTLLD